MGQQVGRSGTSAAIHQNQVNLNASRSGREPPRYAIHARRKVLEVTGG